MIVDDIILGPPVNVPSALFFRYCASATNKKGQGVPKSWRASRACLRVACAIPEKVWPSIYCPTWLMGGAALAFSAQKRERLLRIIPDFPLAIVGLLMYGPVSSNDGLSDDCL